VHLNKLTRNSLNVECGERCSNQWDNEVFFYLAGTYGNWERICLQARIEGKIVIDVVIRLQYGCYYYYYYYYYY
jgi:hypothetical protein